MSCMSSTTMTVTSASMISDDPPYKLVFVFVCLCVYVHMCLYVVEPSGFRVLGFFRCLRRFLSINETSLSCVLLCVGLIPCRLHVVLHKMSNLPDLQKSSDVSDEGGD
jgi:hypothetical protein